MASNVLNSDDYNKLVYFLDLKCLLLWNRFVNLQCIIV